MTTPNQLLFIVDDEVTLADSLAVVFEIKGFKVRVFETAEEALDKFRGGLNPRLIIMDGNLPGMTGPEGIIALRNAGYQGEFIGISAADFEDAMTRAGVKSYWEKPFDLSAFVSAAAA